MRSRAGLSLLEVLVTAFLFSVVLAAVAMLLGQFNRAMSHSARKSQALEGALALRDVAAELEESVALVSPGGAPSSVLEFSRVNPVYPGRLPSPPPTPGGLAGNWLPDDPAYLMTVRYQVNPQAELEREVVVSGSPSRQVIARSLNAFTCTRSGNRVDLRADFQEEQKIRTAVVSANLKAEPWP